MDEIQRPDPDALLAKISRRDGESKRGRLKIFFGMCPGVGKTYAMLQAAKQKHDEGVEVLIGFVETHGRKDTLALVEGLPVAERTTMEYRGALLEEMDLDPILTWHPKLVIVDELAHTNVPGSRHPKRYQDVLELLDAGIDVYTTLNVQHVESRKDTVRQITGIEMRETVPDSILDLASEITLIDLTPSQLRKRLAEGKVYMGEKAHSAAENFFRESNLMALREMALRLTAEHVDRDLRTLKPLSATDPWKAGDRLLVAVGPSPSSEKLIRWTRRMASSMEASWLALTIETPHTLTPKEESQLALNLSLARELGAEVIVVQGVAVGPTVLKIATQHNVSQIIIGKPGPHSFASYFKKSFVNWIVDNSGEIDVHLVRTMSQAASLSSRINLCTPKKGLLEALVIACCVTCLGLALEEITGYRAIALLYLLGVIFASLRLKRLPTLFLASLSAVLWDYLFIPPRFTFYVREIDDFMMLAIFFIVAVTIGHLTTRLRDRELAERSGEARATALYRLSQALASSDDLDSTVAIAVRQIRETFGVSASLILCNESGYYNNHPHPASTLLLGEKEESVAAWVFLKKQIAGRFTDTLPDSESLHLPLLTRESVMGVLSVGITDPLSFQQRELLEAFVTQIALCLEKEQLAYLNRKAQVSAQSEQLQRTLFDSVSHELKTPLAAISAALDQATTTTPLLQEIRGAVNRLTRVVNHLLDMTRLDSGLLQPNLEWCLPEELISEVLLEVRELTITHQISCEVTESTSPILVDERLIKQVLVTLLTNAATYSPAGSSIAISFIRTDHFVRLTVSDSGAGIKRGEEKKIFEKFYRIPGTPSGGIGLGLSVAKRLVEAHGGELTATNNQGGGALFVITLPIKESLQLPVEESS